MKTNILCTAILLFGIAGCGGRTDMYTDSEIPSGSITEGFEEAWRPCEIRHVYTDTVDHPTWDISTKIVICDTIIEQVEIRWK